MSAFEVKDKVLENLKKKKHDLIVTNFANPDMVGHTGDIQATIKAVEVVDKCLGEIYENCEDNGYSLIITSDHGNADNMYDNKKKFSMYHSLN